MTLDVDVDRTGPMVSRFDRDRDVVCTTPGRRAWRFLVLAKPRTRARANAFDDDDDGTSDGWMRARERGRGVIRVEGERDVRREAIERAVVRNDNSARMRMGKANGKDTNDDVWESDEDRGDDFGRPGVALREHEWGIGGDERER